MNKDFDLSKYELVDTSSFNIQSPKGGDLIGADGVNPVVVTVFGLGSKEYVVAKHKLDNANQVRSLAMLRNNKPTDPKEILKSDAEFLAAITKSIENFPVDPLEVYMNPKLDYIKQQVDKYLSETQNFMPT